MLLQEIITELRMPHKRKLFGQFLKQLAGYLKVITASCKKVQLENYIIPLFIHFIAQVENDLKDTDEIKTKYYLKIVFI